MKIIYHPDLDIKLLNYGINIPLDLRASMTFETLAQKFPNELFYVDTGSISVLTEEDLALAHDASYLAQLVADPSFIVAKSYETDRYAMEGKPILAFDLWQQTLWQASASVHAMREALKDGVAFFLGGGMHHARRNMGSGFCLINDIVIGIRKWQREKMIVDAWVIDLDAHKGDGTSEITRSDSSITTLSIHMQDGWPLNDRKLIDYPSDIDIPIAEGEETDYLIKLSQGLDRLNSNFNPPDLAIVVNGADPYEFDELESSSLLKLSKEELLRRDLMVFDFLREKGIPQVYFMAGGYGKRSYEIYTQFIEALRVSRGEVFV